jgi:hypothetical protein
MADQVLIYISAAGDLTFEREVLGRAITEIPTTLAWRIIQTPLAADEPDLDFLAQADVHLLLLGTDVRAPVGVEWLASRRVGHMPALFLRKGSAHTQAAHAFINELQRYTEWRRYEDVADLRKQVLLLLADHILSQHDYYQVKDDEFDKLQTWRRELRRSKRQKVDDTRGGAGDSSIILSAERYMPSDGILLHDPNQLADDDTSLTDRI